MAKRSASAWWLGETSTVSTHARPVLVGDGARPARASASDGSPSTPRRCPNTWSNVRFSLTTKTMCRMGPCGRERAQRPAARRRVTATARSRYVFATTWRVWLGERRPRRAPDHLQRALHDVAGMRGRGRGRRSPRPPLRPGAEPLGADDEQRAARPATAATERREPARRDVAPTARRRDVHDRHRVQAGARHVEPRFVRAQGQAERQHAAQRSSPGTFSSIWATTRAAAASITEMVSLVALET